MRFRRNIEDEKSCRWIAIFSLIAFIILFVIFLVTFDQDLWGLIIPLLIAVPIFLWISWIMRRHFVEFQKDKLLIINYKRSLEIPLSDIEVILIPSPKALKRRLNGNNIIIKRKNQKNLISYSAPIEAYIKENLDVSITFYDLYKQAIEQ